jgi:hypothetical protein
MEAFSPGADALTRLVNVKTRVVALAGKHPWFLEAIRNAQDAFLDLGATYQREMSAMYDRERTLARDLLSKGLLRDPVAMHNGPCLPVRVEGLCPPDLAKRLEKYTAGAAVPADLEREGAAAALAAFDRDEIYQRGNLTDEESEAMAAEYRAAIAARTHVSFSWLVVVSRPADWREPADPYALDLIPFLPKPAETGDPRRDMAAYAAWRYAANDGDSSPEESELARFSEDDYRTIALYRLGGLANSGHLDTSKIPPDVAEQMLGVVERWVLVEAARRGAAFTGDNHLVKSMPAIQPPAKLHSVLDSGPGTDPDKYGLSLRTVFPAHAGTEHIPSKEHEVRISPALAALCGDLARPMVELYHAASTIAGALGSAGQIRWLHFHPVGTPSNGTCERSERDGWIGALRTSIELGMEACNRADRAMQQGGAQKADAILGRNAQGHTKCLEMGLKLQEHRDLLVVLLHAIAFPASLTVEHEGAIREAHAYWQRTARERKQIMEVPLPPTPAPATAAPEMMVPREALEEQTAPQEHEPVAERAAEKAARDSGDRDDNNPDTPPAPAVADALDDREADILSYLCKHDGRRLAVTEVLPDRDRKKTGERLRKLADRCPPLVDYPKGGRLGVAILPAGKEALKRYEAALNPP